MSRSKVSNLSDEAEFTCWLCGRPFGKLIQWHHTVPKSKKGKDTVPLHPICHKTIHVNFSNAELARFGEDRDLLLQNEALGKFVRWIVKKPPDFHARVRTKR